jgi:hypothetical protein
MATKQVHLVRLKPVQPNKGIRVQRYSFRSFIYAAQHGWYRIEDVNLVRALQKLTQRAHDPESPKLFDVCTEAEAAEIDRRERTVRGSVSAPQTSHRSMASGERARPRKTTTTADLREEDEDPPPAPKPPRARAAEPEPEDDEDEVGKMDDDDSGFEEDEESDDGPDVVVDGADDEEEGDDVGKIDDAPAPAPKPRTAAASKKKAKTKPRKRS